MKNENLKLLVKDCLIKNHSLRDNCEKLIEKIWADFLIKKYGGSADYITAFKFLSMVGNNELPSPISIRRYSQMWQMSDASLRGKEYDYRHNIKEKEWREEIRNWNGTQSEIQL